MLLILMAMAIQLAEAPVQPPLDVPDSALRDPYGFILSHCSPLVRRSSESLAACENRVGEAVRTRLPAFRPRPPATTIASASDAPRIPGSVRAAEGRCASRQESRRNADGSSSSASITTVCGDQSGAAASVLDRLMRPN